MPAKVDVKTQIAKMTASTTSFFDLQEEFEVLFATKPQIETLKRVFDGVEGKYRDIKRLQESITNKLYCLEGSDDRLKDIERTGSKVKDEYFRTTQKYSLYQKECQEASKSQEQSTCEEKVEPSALQAMTTAFTKMAEALQMSSTKPPSATSLERLPVPTWDGNRRTYATWKKEFNHAMKNYNQDPDEQLQRFRKAMPKQCWWSEQVKTCKNIDQAWGILDVEFEDKRKLMDSLLADINNLKSVKRDSKSLTMFATTIQRYVNDMGDNGCPVDGSTESPFFMSQLLSKLDPLDNVDFGREMKRQKAEESVNNLLDWLHQEASLRSRGKKEADIDEKPERRQLYFHEKRSLNNATSIDTPTENDESCPSGCTEKHLLPACPVYQSSTLSQRWDAVKKHQRCRKCLRASHHTNDCKKADGTSCDKCKGNHHRSLHNERKSTTSVSSTTDGHQSTKEIANAENNSVQATKQESKKAKSLTALCPVQKIKVFNNEGDSMECIAMLDSGSNMSLLSKRVAKQLGLTGLTTNLTMNLAGGKSRTEVSNLLQITIASISKEHITKSLYVYTVTKPCSNAKTVSKRTLEEFSHLKPVSDKLHLSGGTVDLLIGTDFADAFVDVHTLSGLQGEPIAKRNCFGWYTLGQFKPTSLNEDDSRINSVDIDVVSAEEDIKKLLFQEQIGIRPTKLCTCSEDTLRENKFVKSVLTSTTLQDGRVNVKMPWKEGGPPKRSNYDIALKRMYSSEKTFKKRDCLDIVEDEVQKLIDQDFVIKVPQEEVNHDHPEWYLPLQAVFTPEKTTKVRLVFDATSKGHNGLSLNDYLEKGPNYINNLSDVLIAWRWDNVAYSGDIRKMFNQIVVHPEDQVFRRFFWRKNLEDPPTVYQWRRLCFGDKPAPDIATNSINLLAKASLDEFPEASQELQDHAYVDDIAGSTSKVPEAKQLTKDIDNILAKGQFNIKAWHSNRKEIDTSNEEKTVDLLGHRWDKESDKFSLKKDEIARKQDLLKKRHCLALLAQLWDPIGLVTPVTVKFRIDLQDLWSSGFGWDDILPDSIQQRWNENLSTMNQLLKLDFDRQLKPNDAVGNAEVHGFSDGGELAFGAVIFLRWQLSDCLYCCVPVMMKSFVAPLKKKSVPRLEQLGCVTLVRMYDACTRALAFTDIRNCRKIFWVDSATVLSWVRTPPREFKPFVSARVAEIQETVDTDSFRYVRSKSNPADALTRGIEPGHLAEWLQGPTFLQLPESDWPEFEDCSTSKLNKAEYSEVKGEKKAKSKVQSDVECNTATTSSQATKEATVQKENDNPILAHLLKNCSSFLKMRRTLAYVNRFISNTRESTRTSGPIRVEELKTSEEQLIKWSQVHLNLTKYPELIPKEDGKGVVRAHGRLETITSLPKDMRNPILLPAKHKLTDLILKDIHGKHPSE